jgi:hypothetical protein
LLLVQVQQPLALQMVAELYRLQALAYLIP